ncbi:hypothetical protein LCGC14_0782510 [marine sediment metagenome]|uniref:Uncharacterized protein n=1 Tax=marine sediment metagenome TaxID=412755 RepID=A0A0F9PVB4_9ZZZZ
MSMEQQQFPLSSMPKNQAENYAREFGLPMASMRFWKDLTEAQRDRVNYYFGLINADNYIYAVHSDGGIVSKREKRNPLMENKR